MFPSRPFLQVVEDWTLELDGHFLLPRWSMERMQHNSSAVTVSKFSLQFDFEEVFLVQDVNAKDFIEMFVSHSYFIFEYACCYLIIEFPLIIYSDDFQREQFY